MGGASAMNQPFYMIFFMFDGTVLLIDKMLINLMPKKNYSNALFRTKVLIKYYDVNI